MPKTVLGMYDLPEGNGARTNDHYEIDPLSEARDWTRPRTRELAFSRHRASPTPPAPPTTTIFPPPRTPVLQSKAENPDLSGIELRKVMSDSKDRLYAKWRELTPEGKAAYKERYATEKAAYESKMAAEEVGVAPTRRSRDCAADTAAAAAATAAIAAA